MAPAEQPQRWFPLESNPTLMNDYIQALGFATHSYHFVDVFSTEDWALEMIPQPVVAVLMLYPLTEKQLACETAAAAEPSSSTRTPPQPNDTTTTTNANNNDNDDEVWFTKQRIGNACGTIGLLHSLLNTPAPLLESSLLPNSWLAKFHADTTTTLESSSSASRIMDPIQRAERLESDTAIAQLHDAATSSEQNQTGRGSLDDNVVTHFVAIVERNGVVYTLDGRKEGPVAHGGPRTTKNTLLADACTIVQQYMQRDPTEVRFTILALAPNTTEE